MRSEVIKGPKGDQVLSLTLGHGDIFLSITEDTTVFLLCDISSQNEHPQPHRPPCPECMGWHCTAKQGLVLKSTGGHDGVLGKRKSSGSRTGCCCLWGKGAAVVQTNKPDVHFWKEILMKTVPQSTSSISSSTRCLPQTSFNQRKTNNNSN